AAGVRLPVQLAHRVADVRHRQTLAIAQLPERYRGPVVAEGLEIRVHPVPELEAAIVLRPCGILLCPCRGRAGQEQGNDGQFPRHALSAMLRMKATTSSGAWACTQCPA